MFLSMGEMLVIFGAAVVLFGPKDVPRIARLLGRAAGTATGDPHPRPAAHAP